MEFVRLGRTNMMVSRSGFGALPIQRIGDAEAVHLLQSAYEQGINFFDTARAYSDSEQKLGLAFGGMKQRPFIATKSHATNKTDLMRHLTTSLQMLKADYVDILQLHNPSVLPDPNDADGLYAGLVEAKEKGMVRFIGITNHRLALAIEAVRSGLYDTVQYPMSLLSSEEELALVDLCEQHNVGLIAMKALSGGLITNASLAFAFLRQFQGLVPIWGIQYEHELAEFIAMEKQPPQMDAAMLQAIENERAALVGDFCRGCGYCLPCPAEIPIPMAARISLLLQRAPYQQYTTAAWQESIARISNCIECGHCKEHCPYGLDTPAILRQQLAEYQAFIAQLPR
jgi:predicted aldo/keto reductase-like oxidoreductase